MRPNCEDEVDTEEDQYQYRDHRFKVLCGFHRKETKANRKGDHCRWSWAGLKIKSENAKGLKIIITIIIDHSVLYHNRRQTAKNAKPKGHTVRYRN